MRKTTYELLSEKIENLHNELIRIGKENNLYCLSLKAEQLNTIKEDIARLLWVEYPELNESGKIEAVNKMTHGMVFHAGIFEIDGMRLAFLKRLASNFFHTEKEKNSFVSYAEDLYSENTQTHKDFLREKMALANRK